MSAVLWIQNSITRLTDWSNASDGTGRSEGGNALLDVLTGAVTPSGKLADTWAENYSDYPASDTFANADGNVKKEVYNEGIYVGYRYFDTFNITPKYEFGYGLSYTDFKIETQSVTADADKVTVKVKVTNTGSTYSGKEIVQVLLFRTGFCRGRERISGTWRICKNG